MSIHHKLSTVGLAVALIPSVLAADGSSADPGKTRGFVDITRDSGVGELLEEHYAAHPRWWLSGLHLVDLDGDERLDLLFSAHGEGGPALAALGDGRGRFQRAPGSWPPSEVHLAYDFDEDGRVDLTMTWQDGGGRWWRNLSRPGELEFQPTGMTRGTNTARRQAMIDIDRDGRADWLRGSGTGIHFDLADGQGNFTARGPSNEGKPPEAGRESEMVPGDLKFGPQGQSERLCLPVDIDGDGLIDLLTEWGHYAEPEGHSRIFLNSGGLRFADITAAAGVPLSGVSIKGVGDVDQDGDVDLVCLEDRRVEIYLNDGKGHFAKKGGAIRGDPGRAAAASWGLAAVTDLDNDGIPDLIIDGKHFLKVLRGAGGAEFAYMNPEWGIRDLAASSVDDGLCFGDIDGDCRLDIVGYTDIGNRKRVAVYKSELPPGHWLNVRPVGLAGNRGAAGAKIRIHEPGTGRLLWYEQVTIHDSQAAASYYAFARTERHFGLGDRTAVDVSVEFYPSGATIRRADVRANQTIEISEATSRAAAAPAALQGEGPASGPKPLPDRGPLRAHPANPRYFTDGSGKPIFLTGSHTWGNFQDYRYEAQPSPPPMDFAAYLEFLKRHGHNFFRLWVWETAMNRGAKQSTVYYDPLPYERPGPEAALDGQPRFDLTSFNRTYFERLRARVLAARESGMYVSVMLFNGFSVEGKGNVGGDPWQGHPFNPKNNVNGIDGAKHPLGGCATHTLSDPRVTALQEAHLRKVIDSVGDQDNVLYEITNEDSASPENSAWQFHMIRIIKAYEAGKARQHPVGMTRQWPGDDGPLLESPADWISPGEKLPAADGRKVVINDTDHSYFWTGLKEDGPAAQRAWVWENFTRGCQCLFMDPYLDPSHDPGRNRPAGGKPDPYWDGLRDAMGRTRSCAARMNLAAAVPHGELASTKFCLADPGREYLVYAPNGGEVTVDLSAVSGHVDVEWMRPDDGTISRAGLIAGGGPRSLKAPFEGDAVLYLQGK
jgi:hypothetical protein